MIPINTINSHYLYGLIPFLYIAQTLQAALSICLALALLFAVCMGIVILARGIIPHDDKYLFYALISVTCVSIFSLVLEAWFYPIKQGFAMYLFIIPMNTTLICVLDDCLYQDYRRVLRPAVLCLAGGLLFGGLRELLATGAIYIGFPSGRQQALLCLPACDVGGISLFAYSAGALLLAGLMLALVNSLARPGE